MNYATPKEVEKFSKWLVSQGCEILPATNDWEMLRFKCGTTMGLAYTSKKAAPCVSTANCPAKTAWNAWKSGNPLPLSGKPKRKKRSKRDQIVDALIERDGDQCWFCTCGWDNDHPQTVEHLVPIAHGGPNHLSNIVLACGPCNTLAGHLSVAEKVELRDAICRKHLTEKFEVPPSLVRELQFLELANIHEGGAS